MSQLKSDSILENGHADEVAAGVMSIAAKRANGDQVVKIENDERLPLFSFKGQLGRNLDLSIFAKAIKGMTIPYFCVNYKKGQVILCDHPDSDTHPVPKHVVVANENNLKSFLLAQIKEDVFAVRVENIGNPSEVLFTEQSSDNSPILIIQQPLRG